jgi:predicted CoA-binding protein
MQDIKEAAAAFLANKRVAVTGVSRTPKTHGSNTVYKRLRERSYDVFATRTRTRSRATPATRTWPRSPAVSTPW